VSLSSTEITPGWLQRHVFIQYHLKTVPCLLIWVLMQAELLFPGLTRLRKRSKVNEPDLPPAEPSAYS
jgi:hypothetical protein